MLTLDVAMTGEHGDELFLRQAICTWETIDTLLNLDQMIAEL